ncbi:MAG: 3-keto-5-aminohexanoate cleavage protein [Caulobacterales bacterium 68-7]|nr:MAG: 3-keto-5-aminohexanoate cleavage protein [Caulobacterales bacterium 68-7]
MHNAIATVSLSGTLEDKLAAAAAAGFTSVEIFENDLLGSALSPRGVRSLMDDLGIGCSLYQPFRDFEGMPGALRQRALDRAERKFDLMGELGVDRILVCSNCQPASLGDRQRIVDDFHELGERARPRGVRVGYEALAWGRHVFDHRDVWEIVKAVDHPNVGIILDSFHSLSRRVPSESIRDIRGDKIVYVQLADAPVLEMDLLYWSRHFRNLPGQGGFDLTGYVAEILRTGYDGPLSLEIFNDRFRSYPASLVASDGMRSLDSVRDAALRRIGRTPTLPPIEPILAAEFVEFTASPSDAERLGAMCRALGFVQVGAHRSKQVTRWRRGEANLVINSEPTGFAASYRYVHGASICAIGVRVGDRQAVVDRAAALRIDRFEETGQQGNLAMPALRGVGGSLVYLVQDDRAEQLWADEFAPAEAAQPGGASEATRFDHLAAVVMNDEFLSWQLYWRSLFGLQPRAAQDVIDPLGLVQSQALQSQDGAFRVTLNATDAPGTLSGRFLSHGFGGGYQHVALRVDDLLATAEGLKTRQAELLPISPNYYDDLIARFGFDASMASRLSDLGMLYDEDADGLYWQVYSRAFDKTFFFEFVQRDKAYQGYGAPNAGIRIAAQGRYRADEPTAL